MADITLDDPLVIPPTHEKTFDVFWVQRLEVEATDPNTAVIAFVRIRKASNNGGVYELAPDVEGASGSFTIPNLFAECATDMTPMQMQTLGGGGPPATVIMADVVTALMQLLKRKAVEAKAI